MPLKKYVIGYWNTNVRKENKCGRGENVRSYRDSRRRVRALSVILERGPGGVGSFVTSLPHSVTSAAR